MAHLESNRAIADTLLEQLAWIGQRMDHVRAAYSGNVEADRSQDFKEPQRRIRGSRGGRGGRGGDDADFVIEIRQARRALEAALIATFGASVDEQKQIADILERAAREIRGE